MGKLWGSQHLQSRMPPLTLLYGLLSRTRDRWADATQDTAHGWETERRQQMGFPIRCADHTMKLALAGITIHREVGQPI